MAWNVVVSTILSDGPCRAHFDSFAALELNIPSVNASLDVLLDSVSTSAIDKDSISHRLDTHAS